MWYNNNVRGTPNQTAKKIGGINYEYKDKKER